MARKPSKTKDSSNYLSKIEGEIQSNQSKLSMVLGALIVLVIGILVFNYFSRGKPSLGPAQQTEEQQIQNVTPSSLPGKYTVKEEDTLFTIAENYYQDGSKFEEIAKTNNITDVNLIKAGQVLEIPKLADVSPVPSPEINLPNQIGSPNITDTDNEWGSKITGTTYTVQEGDWLSKIAGRAYGDIFAYKKLAEANNIQNPDLIYPGQVLTIPQ